MNVVQERPSQQTATANAVNAVATATLAAPTASVGLRHHVTHVSFSFSAAVTGIQCTLKDGTTILMSWRVTNVPTIVTFASPIAMTPGNACSVEAGAGGVGITGEANIAGYTI